jgi:DNA-binding NarL/FixJ family response regulator
MTRAGALKILIAEDHAGLRRVIRRVVAGLAGNVVDCVLARELEQTYAAWAPDFVVIDAEMKTMDVITAVRSIKAVDPSAKAIIVSSYDCAELREAAMEAGAVGYVRKEDLLEIGRLLESYR